MTDSDPPRTSWVVIDSDSLLEMLRRCHAGEQPDLVFLESYANADVADVSAIARCAQWIPVAAQLMLGLLAAYVIYSLLTP